MYIDVSRGVKMPTIHLSTCEVLPNSLLSHTTQKQICTTRWSNPAAGSLNSIKIYTHYHYFSDCITHYITIQSCFLEVADVFPTMVEGERRSIHSSAELKLGQIKYNELFLQNALPSLPPNALSRYAVFCSVVLRVSAVHLQCSCSSFRRYRYSQFSLYYTRDVYSSAQ